jgi:hypothetical protein
MAWAARTFQSAVRAWPSSSMQVATTAAPNSAASDKKPSRRVPGPSPSSRLTEFRIALPPSQVSAWRATTVSVVSTMIGTDDCVARRLMISSMSLTPSAPV